MYVPIIVITRETVKTLNTSIVIALSTDFVASSLSSFNAIIRNNIRSDGSSSQEFHPCYETPADAAHRSAIVSIAILGTRANYTVLSEICWREVAGLVIFGIVCRAHVKRF